jgi:hypothetical protein
MMRLGRQRADHSSSEGEMLRVRIPPEPLDGDSNGFSYSRPGGGTGRHTTLRMSCPEGRGSSSLPLVTELMQARQVPGELSYGSLARIDTGACNSRVGQCSVRPHKPRSTGATPVPAPISVSSRGPTATTPGPHPGNGGSTPSGTTHSMVRRCYWPHASSVRRWSGFDPRADLSAPLRAASPTERLLACNQAIGVRLPGCPLILVPRIRSPFSEVRLQLIGWLSVG